MSLNEKSPSPTRRKSVDGQQSASGGGSKPEEAKKGHPYFVSLSIGQDTEAQS
tara:strand:+ start:6044 stop:6202 length:159 start_codon:yes stop_codon:yes gene_type:complete